MNDFQDYTPNGPEDIHDIIQEASKKLGYGSINKFCEAKGINQPTMNRILNKLSNSDMDDDDKFATLHMIKIINQALHLDYIVTILDDSKLKNKHLKEWVLDLDRVIDLNMLRCSQNHYFYKNGNPRRNVNGMKAKTPEESLLFKSYYYSRVSVSAAMWNKAMQNHQEPGRDTPNMSLGYFLKLLADLKLKLTIRRYNVESDLSRLSPERCHPEPDDQFLIGRYRSISQYNLSRYHPFLYYVRKGCDSRGKPYTSDEVLHATPDYILLVPVNSLISVPDKSEEIEYTIFKHDGKIRDIDNDELKEYGYVSRSTVKVHQAYGLESIVEGVTINVDNLLKYLGKNQHPIIRYLSELKNNNILVVPDQEEMQSLVAQEDKPE